MTHVLFHIRFPMTISVKAKFSFYKFERARKISFTILKTNQDKSKEYIDPPAPILSVFLFSGGTDSKRR